MKKFFSWIFGITGFIFGSFGILCHFSNEVAKEKLRQIAPLPAELKLDPLILDPNWLIYLLFGGCIFFIFAAAIIGGCRKRKDIFP
ncbi:hypothetical protein KAI52_03395 [Candidatus Parcubacteria bacterium]|nr:hypothetical protein [Candidatus Parcubacteria bacterium]